MTPLSVIGRFRNGALATIEATRFAPGRKNGLTIEINGSGGSLYFDLEEMNRLHFYDSVATQIVAGISRHHRDRAFAPLRERMVAAWTSSWLRAHLRAHDCRFR